MFLLANTSSLSGENWKYTKVYVFGLQLIRKFNDIHSLYAQLFLITIQYEKIKLWLTQAISIFSN